VRGVSGLHRVLRLQGGQVPDEFNQGSASGSQSTSVPQATPQVVLIDRERCIEFKTGKCKKSCVEACDRDAIDFKQEETFDEVAVGAIIVATGFRAVSPERVPYYGYGKYKNVFTALESNAWSTPPDRPAARSCSATGAHPGRSDHPLRRLARRTDQPLVQPGLLHVLAQARAPHQGAHRGRGLQLLHRHADAGEGLRGVLDKVLKEGVHFIRGRVAR